MLCSVPPLENRRDVVYERMNAYNKIFKRQEDSVRLQKIEVNGALKNMKAWIVKVPRDVTRVALASRVL